MKRKIVILLVLSILAEFKSVAQNFTPNPHSFEVLLETIAGDMEEGEEYSAWVEELQHLYDHPLNINLAKKEELLRIPFINEAIVTAIIAYREKSGPFLTEFELASVPGINPDLAEKISWFISAGEVLLKDKYDTARHRPVYQEVLTKSWVSLPTGEEYRRDGEKPPVYRGGPEKLYLRYIIEAPGRFTAAMTGDKDPGEPFFGKSSKSGFDAYSMYVSLNVNQWFHQLVVGDFTARTGQGLVMWQGFSMGKSDGIIQASKNISQIKPYSSTDENRFFRGVGATLKRGNSAFNFFISSKMADANLSLSEDSIQVFTSLQSSGYHRTLSECGDKKSVRHSVAGAFGTWYFQKWKGGVTALYERFQYPMAPGDQLYQQYYFKGRENYNVSADYRMTIDKYQLFGEAAVSKSGGAAFIQGLEASLHDQLNLTVLFRHFDKNYHATWASAFATNDKAANETGLYAGIKIYPFNIITVTAYADWFTSPWIRYTTAAPSKGEEFMIQSDFRFSRRFTGYARMRHREGEFKTTNETMHINESRRQNNLRLHTDYRLNNQFSLRSRLETVLITSPVKEQGILLFQDIAWAPPDKPYNAVFRIEWFSSDSWNARIYAFENDLLYNFSTLALFGEGLRTYLNGHLKLAEDLDGWAKIGYTLPFDEKSAVTEEDNTSTETRAEIKIQLRYRF